MNNGTEDKITMDDFFKSFNDYSEKKREDPKEQHKANRAYKNRNPYTHKDNATVLILSIGDDRVWRYAA